MRVCICGGCSNSDLLSDHLRFHGFPDRRKDGASFRAWVHFVQVKRKDFFFDSVTKYMFVCAAHFRPEDYISGDMMEFRMGFRSEKRVRLKAGVVPSIHAASGSATGGSEAHRPVRDSTIRKRELCTMLGNTARFEATDAPTASEDSEQEAVASLASQTKSVRLFGSQCHITPPYRSSVDCNVIRDRRTQRGATSERLHVDAPGSSHMSSHNGELRILSVHGKGEGPLAVDSHETLFTMFKLEASSCEELSVQQTPDTISIKVEEDIGGGMPAVEDCDAFGDLSTQCSFTSEGLHVDAPGSSHMSSHNGELRILSVHGKGEGPLAVDSHDTLFTVFKLEASSCEELSVQQTPDTISIKVEEDIGGGMPAVEDCNDIRDGSTRGEAPSERLHVDAPGSSHMSSHNGELRILSVHGKGEGPLAVDGRGTLFIASDPDAPSSLSADHSVAKSLDCSVRLVRCEELTGPRGGREGRTRILLGKGVPDNTKTTIHTRTHTDEKPYGCDQCMKRFPNKSSLKIHVRSHSGEKPYSCDQCMKRFGANNHLKRHIRTHSREKPYSCDLCMKRFGRSSSLKIHMRTHSGEKLHRCDQCVNSYRNRHSLKSHMKMHSREMPYSCGQCVNSYPRKGSLKRHMKVHSGEKPC